MVCVGTQECQHDGRHSDKEFWDQPRTFPVSLLCKTFGFQQTSTVFEPGFPTQNSTQYRCCLYLSHIDIHNTSTGCSTRIHITASISNIAHMSTFSPLKIANGNQQDGNFLSPKRQICRWFALYSYEYQWT